jgi:hypothetical protein
MMMAKVLGSKIKVQGTRWLFDGITDAVYWYG